MAKEVLTPDKITGNAKFISRSLIVGLGGSGQNIIKEVRKRIFEKYGEIPRLIDFLAIDTTLKDVDTENHVFVHNGVKNVSQKYNIEEADFKRLMVSDLASYLNGENKTYKYINKESVQKHAALMSNMGANGFRVLGRMYLLINHPEILKTIETKIANLRNIGEADSSNIEGYATQSRDIAVFIVGSIAGGTCSGTFLDIAQLVRIAFGDGHNDSTFGIFMLPGFFENKPNTENKYLNGYSALSELDFILEPGNILASDPKLVNHYNNHDYPVDKKLFQNVFLVDTITSNDLSIEDKEAFTYISSFITNSVCVPADKLRESFVNNIHCQYTHQGRRRNYSSLSFLEIYFDRVTFRSYLLDYMVNKKIESFLQADDGSDMLDKAQKFIKENNLDEGKDEASASSTNNLIDSVYRTEEQVFITHIIGSISTGKDAGSKIVASKETLINNLKVTISGLISKFEPQKQKILNNLVTELEEVLYSKGFATNIPLFVRYLLEDISKMEEYLKTEISIHKKTIETIEKELSKKAERIKQYERKGFLGIGSQEDLQEKEIKMYQSLVSGKERTHELNDISRTSLKWQIIQLARKEAGLVLFGLLLDKLKEYYSTKLDKKKNIVIEGHFVDMQEKFFRLKSNVDNRVASYKPVEVDKFRINLHSFLKNEVNIKHKIFSLDKDKSGIDENQNVTAQEVPVEELFKTDLKGVNIDKLIDEFKNRVDAGLPEHSFLNKMKDGKEVSIDDVFIYFYGDGSDIENSANLEKYPQLKIINAVQNKLCFLWKHKNIDTENSDRNEESGSTVTLEPQKILILSVSNTNNYIFNKKNKYSELLNVIINGKTSNNDPDKIVFIGLEAAISAFHIEGVKTMYKEFLARQEIYSATDTRLESNFIQMIYPDPTNNKADKAWAYGWLLGLIVNNKQRIMLLINDARYASDHDFNIDSNGYYDYFYHKKQSASDLAVCKKAFSQNDLLVDYISRETERITELDLENVKIKIQKWINEKEAWDEAIRGKQEISMKPAEKKTINEEIATILESFEKLNGRGRKIGIDGLTKKVIIM